MGKKELNYDIRPTEFTLPVQELFVTNGFLSSEPFFSRNGTGYLSVFKGKQLLTIIPYRSFQGDPIPKELFSIAENLWIIKTKPILDLEALMNAFKRSRINSRPMIVHLPFLCPELPVLLKQTHPFIDMGAFNKEIFLKARRWLKRQHAKWPNFQFSAFEFDFDRDRELAYFYIKNCLRRFKLSREGISRKLEEFRICNYTLHTAVLRLKRDIVAVFFFRLDLLGNLFLIYTAFNHEFIDFAPGNAMRFNLLCYIKENNLAAQVYLGPLYPTETASYKLKWSKQSGSSYLYLV